MIRVNIKSNKGQFTMDPDHIAYMENVIKVQPTNDEFKYGTDPVEGVVQAIFSNRSFVESICESENLIGIVLNSTSFYAEQGGQISDIGLLQNNHAQFQVTDCQLFAGIVVHIGSVIKGAIKIGDNLLSETDLIRRSAIKPNHTFTHVLNHVLRAVLGNHVHQKGSLVDDHKLRFDFSHFSAMKPEDVKGVEQRCNEVIGTAFEVYTKVVSLEDARQITSIRCLSGETYSDPVRVVSIGNDVNNLISKPTDEKWRNYSVELCGGTHLSNTSEAEHFTILSEQGIAKGVRRIVALTSSRAASALSLGAALLAEVDQIRSLLDPGSAGAAIAKIRSQLDEQTSKIPATFRYQIDLSLQESVKAYLAIKKSQSKKLEANAVAVIDGAVEKGSAFIVHEVDLDAKSLKSILTQCTKKRLLERIAIMLVSNDDGKGKCVILAQSPPAGSTINAFDWVSAAMKPVGGKAFTSRVPCQPVQGSAPDPIKVAQIVAAAEQFANSL